MPGCEYEIVSVEREGNDNEDQAVDAWAEALNIGSTLWWDASSDHGPSPVRATSARCCMDHETQAEEAEQLAAEHLCAVSRAGRVRGRPVPLRLPRQSC